MVHPKCTGYEIFFSNAAKKDLQKINYSETSKIFAEIRLLISDNIDLLNIKKLKSNFPLYRYS